MGASTELEVRVEEARQAWSVASDYWQAAKRRSNRLEQELGYALVGRGGWSRNFPALSTVCEEYWSARAAYLEFGCALSESIALGRAFDASVYEGRKADG